MNKVLFSSNSEEWETPQELYNKLDAIFKFELDPCATSKNAKCFYYYTKERDGLSQNWGGLRVFCNPPYGRTIGNWVKKSFETFFQNNKADTIVLLLPARTDTNWFHNYIYNKSEIIFLKGRLHFNNSKNAAPFPSMVVIYRGREDYGKEVNL